MEPTGEEGDMDRRLGTSVAARIAVALGVAMVIAGCSSSASSAPTAPPTAGPTTPTSTPTGASSSIAAATAGATTTGTVSCPTAPVVGAALGLTLSAPTAVPGGGGAPLPAGATGEACDYRGTASNVLIELISNIDPSAIGQFSAKFPVPYATVAGVGDQARSFRQDLNGGKDNEAVVATKGKTLVEITATATPASLAQVEALVSQLL
jgi:hypothetical protein